MKPVEIELLHSVSRPTVHPDGSRAVVAVSHPHLDSDSNVGQLWMVPIDGSGARRFTRGVNDFSPRFSPDGRVIAFLRATPGNPPQLHLLDSGGGEPMRITDQKLGVSEFSWSEDSTRIAFVARVPEPGRYGTVDDIGGGAEPGRHITGLRYKSNGLGYTNDRRSQLFLVKVPSLSLEPSYEPAPLPDGSKPPVSHVPDALQLTHGDYDVSSPRFLGERAAFVSARHESRDRDLRNQIWAVGLDGTSDPEALTPTESPIGIGTFEPSSRGIHFVGQDTGASGTDFVAKNAALYRLNDSGPVQLTDPETTDFADGSLTVLQDSVLATDRSRGTQQLVEVGDGTSRRLTSGDVMVLGHDAANGEIVVSYATPDTFGDVGVLRDGELTRLTDFSAALRETDLIMPTELLVSGRDGYDIHGWVAKPQTEGPHPTFLLIHGGPFADYNVQVFDEVQVLVEAGYAVVYCNPRGSAGYGQDHGLAIRQAMGTVDLHDVIDFSTAPSTATRPSTGNASAYSAGRMADTSRRGRSRTTTGSRRRSWSVVFSIRRRSLVRRTSAGSFRTSTTGPTKNSSGRKARKRSPTGCRHQRSSSTQRMTCGARSGRPRPTTRPSNSGEWMPKCSSSPVRTTS